MGWFYRLLPIVVGFAIGIFIVLPPPLLNLPWYVRLALVIPAGALVLFFLTMLLVEGAMPADLKLTPIDHRKVTEAMVELFNKFHDAGFQLAGAPLRVQTRPPATLVPLIDEQSQMYASIYRTSTDPPKTSYDIVSALEPQGSLTTGPAIEGASLPARPGSLYQVFPGADVHVLRRKHEEALQYLLQQGIRAKPASAETFPQDFKNAVADMRKHFGVNPLKHTWIILYRTMTGTTPHMGPIQNQPAAQQMLRRMKSGQV